MESNFHLNIKTRINAAQFKPNNNVEILVHDILGFFNVLNDDQLSR